MGKVREFVVAWVIGGVARIESIVVSDGERVAVLFGVGVMFCVYWDLFAPFLL